MKNIKRWLWILIIIILLFIYLFFGYIRGIEITVVDSITKKPLENVLIYYLLDGRRSEFVTISGTGSRILKSQKFITDKAGKVHVKSLFFFKYLFEGFGENISVNMDTRVTQFTYVDMRADNFIYIPKTKIDDPAYNFFSNHSGCPKLNDSENMVFNPNNEYYGFVVFGSDSFNNENNQYDRFTKYTLFWNNHSLGKLCKEKIIVYLEPKKR